MRRAVTIQDIEAIWRELGAIAVEAFNAKGSHAPAMFGIRLGANFGEIASASAVQEAIIEALFSPESTGSMQRAFMRKLLDPPAQIAAKLPDAVPDLVLAISEAWTVSIPQGSPRLEGVERYGAEAQADREEAVVLIFHAKGIEAVGRCPIDPTTRKARVGDLLSKGIHHPQ